MANVKMEQVRKITLGTIGAQPSLEEIAKMEKTGMALELADVYGIATKFKPDDSDKGPFVRFYGSFRAVNLRTKQVFTAGTMILPKLIEEGLFAVMSAEGVNNVRFAFRVRAKFDKKAATKYVYAAESLTPTSEDDPVALLERQVFGKALAAPEKK